MPTEGDAAPGHVRALPGGYHAPLAGWDPARLGWGVQVVELDMADEATAHEILTDIMAGKKAGVFSTTIMYRGKHPRRWLEHLAPAVLHPRHYGLLSPAGDLLGWLSLMGTFTRADVAQLGITMRPAWTGKGLGSAVLGHVLAERDRMYHHHIPILLLVVRQGNAAMLRLVQKQGTFVDNGVAPDGGRSFSTSPVSLPPARELAEPPR